LEEHLFSYRHQHREWAIGIKAASREGAEARLNALAFAHYLGPADEASFTPVSRWDFFLLRVLNTMAGRSDADEHPAGANRGNQYSGPWDRDGRASNRPSRRIRSSPSRRRRAPRSVTSHSTGVSLFSAT
jgi:hypothetical protein